MDVGSEVTAGRVDDLEVVHGKQMQPGCRFREGPRGPGRLWRFGPAWIIDPGLPIDAGPPKDVRKLREVVIETEPDTGDYRIGRLVERGDHPDDDTRSSAHVALCVRAFATARVIVVDPTAIPIPVAGQVVIHVHDQRASGVLAGDHGRDGEEKSQEDEQAAYCDTARG